MFCDKCGNSLRLRSTGTNGRRETWTCERKACVGREVLELWGRPKYRQDTPPPRFQVEPPRFS